jgi:protocatechuate 3,4-dioxygenase beta subunit
VNLYYDVNNSLADTQTVLAGSNGTYSFVNVDPDDYYVEFVLPSGSGYRFIAPDTGNDDTIDSDVDINTGRTPTETILSNEFNNTLDAGIYIPASIGDRVWLDANANGIQDVGESNVSDLNVTLYDDANNSVATTVTDVNGSYLFSGLVPGDYHVEFALTDNSGQSYEVSPQGVMTGADDTNNSDANATGVTPVETLISGEQNPDYDAGLYIPVSIGDVVWSDKDGNGVQNIGEPGIADVNVTLYREENNGTVTTIGSQDTNSTGGYLFTDLVPGHYYVHFEQPDHFRATVQNSGTDDAADSDADRVSGNTASFELFSPEDNLTIDAGFYELATISGNVSEDTDNDDSGDVNLQFVDIALVDSNGVTVATTQTDINGSYLFTDIEPGSYTIVETQPAGLASVSENEGGDDNDPDNTTLDNIISVIVGIGEVDTGNDFVEEEAVTLGDRVWNDENGNGIQDAGETNTTGLSGIVVNLYNDQDLLVATTTTDADGEYLFEDYPEDTYYVGFDLSTLPAHYGVTRQDQGSDDSNDSDVAIATGMTGMDYLAPGEDNRTFDMGIYLLGVISGTVWEDTNSDSIGDTPMAGVEIILYDEQGNEVARTVTAADGTYIFRDLPQGIYTIRETQPDGYLDVGETDGDLPNDGSTNAITVTLDAGEYDTDNDFIDEIGGSIGNYVWHDTNGNGLQDPDETGINAVHVCLEDSDGNAILNPDGSQRCTDTNATGYYLFEGIIPGDYIVVFTIPQGTTLTPFPQEGTDTETDSDPLEVIGGFASAPVSMGLGEDILSVDMGLVYLGTASIGDMIWVDENRDGIFDAHEAGLDGVTVNLYDDQGHLVESIITHDGGRYLFEHLYAGTYVVEFVVPDALGYEFTDEHIGSGDEDSDVDTISGRTDPIVLREGEHVRVIDAGVYCGCENAPIKANGGNAFGLVGMLVMMLMTLMTALFFVRREEMQRR